MTKKVLTKLINSGNTEDMIVAYTWISLNWEDNEIFTFFSGFKFDSINKNAPQIAVQFNKCCIVDDTDRVLVMMSDTQYFSAEIKIDLRTN